METLVNLLDQLSRTERPDLCWARSSHGFQPLSSAAFVADVRRCSRALVQLGVDRGDRVGLIAHNRPEWHIVDFGCHLLGAVLVPLYGTLTPARVRFILADSGSRVVFLEGREQLAKVVSVRQQLPELERIVFLDPSDPEGEVALESGARYDVGDVIAFEEFLASGDGGGEVVLRGPDGPDALATLIYTSGTTGDPKGVMLTHRNLISNAQALLQVLPAVEGDRTLSVLPLCHVFQRTVDYTNFLGGASITYGCPKRMAEDLLLVRPTVMVGVPRLYERFQAAVQQRVAESGPLQRALFSWAERVGMRQARARLGDTRPGIFQRLQHAVADLLVLRKIRAAAGGHIRYFNSGGAALEPALNWWFEAMGLTLLQGYGLTESSPVIAVNPRDANRIGTVGPPLPGVEVKIAADGEILTRGPHVMNGYWRNPEATAETIVDGWLQTGDIGSLDEAGYLSVTDRKKHILVTSTGKNVAPQPLENALAQSPYINQVAVIGDGRKFISGLIVPQFAQLERWAAERGLETEHSSLCREPSVIELIQQEVDRLQADFAPYERVRAFRLLDAPFTIEDGTLTPTLKSVRRIVESKYAGLIEEIYGQPPPE
ncbi:MAG: AMP-dependent synthetase/ligase [Acidobacteriota bacterium]